MKFASVLSACLALASSALAYNATGPVTYLGSQSRLLSGGASAQGLVFTSGTVPFLNGTLVKGGIKNETVSSTLHPSSLLTTTPLTYTLFSQPQAQVIKNIALILKEAGTSWSHVLKCTVFLADMADYAAMNEVYQAMLPYPKPARTAVQVAKLPGAFSVEIEAIAAVPYY
jgi:2-iminobutanoate/2-iminopropanoate deaminase